MHYTGLRNSMRAFGDRASIYIPQRAHEEGVGETSGGDCYPIPGSELEENLIEHESEFTVVSSEGLQRGHGRSHPHEVAGNAGTIHIPSSKAQPKVHSLGNIRVDAKPHANTFPVFVLSGVVDLLPHSEKIG